MGGGGPRRGEQRVGVESAQDSATDVEDRHSACRHAGRLGLARDLRCRRGVLLDVLLHESDSVRPHEILGLLADPAPSRRVDGHLGLGGGDTRLAQFLLEARPWHESAGERTFGARLRQVEDLHKCGRTPRLRRKCKIHDLHGGSGLCGDLIDLGRGLQRLALRESEEQVLAVRRDPAQGRRACVGVDGAFRGRTGDACGDHAKNDNGRSETAEHKRKDL